MDTGDTTTVALAGIIATGTVGVLGPAFTGLFAARARRQENRARREDELRAVIEGAAVRLTEAIGRLDQARDRMADHVPNPVMPALDEDAEQLWLNEDRIGVRLGTNAPETAAFSRAVSAWLSAYRSLADLSAGGEKSGEELAAITKDRNTAYEAAQDFKNAAAARLSPDASWRSRRAARRRASSPSED